MSTRDAAAAAARSQPHDLDAERAVLGGMLSSENAIDDVAGVGLRAEHHYRPAHQIIHEIVLDLHSRGSPVDPVTVLDELRRRKVLSKVGGGPYLHTVIAAVPTAANAGYYARIVVELAERRKLIEVGRRIVQVAEAPDLDLGAARELAIRDLSETGERTGERENVLDITEEPDAVRLITEAISGGRFSEVYLRGDQLVQVTSGEKSVLTRDVDEPILRRLVADNLPCTRRTRDGIIGALPLPITCKAILALPQWPKVRRLRGVATFPVPLADGTVLQQPGYDATSGLFLREGLSMAPIPDKPSAQQVDGALSFLLSKFLADFPWISDSDRANALAMLLTPLLREIIDDVFPFPYITAPERGSGKTLLADLVSILYGGAMRTLPKDEKEVEKTITSALRGAAPVIVFDNIPQDVTIKSPALAALLTMRYWTARILGGSRDGTWPNDRLWIATGTNVSLGGDFAQRSMRIAMDYGKPNPDQRRGFQIPNIKEWTIEHRGEVLWHLLVLIRAWQLGGAQRDERYVMRGYTTWAKTIAGVLGFHDVEGFLANRDEVVGQDEDGAEMAIFFHMLRARYGSFARTARQILTDAAADSELADSLPSTLDGGKWTTRSLGKKLSDHEGKWYGRRPKLTVRRKQDSSEISWWRVEEAAD